MSSDFEKLAKDFLGGDNSKIRGKTDDIKKLASSSDGQKVMKMMGNTDNVKKALESGDSAAIQGYIKTIMSSDEGARLAKQLNDLLK